MKKGKRNSWTGIISIRVDNAVRNVILLAMMSMIRILVPMVLFLLHGKGHAQQGNGSLPDSVRFPAPEMVFVRGGTFAMGSTLGSKNERPVHQVRVNDFYIGRFEITQKQWREVMGIGTTENYFPGCDSCPVERVNFYNVQEFLERLNRMTGQYFRLPTEAEWEYAARGGSLSKKFKYSGGNDINSVAWKDGNADKHTHPVGTKHPNELGIYDMSGNVWEWCSDFYAPDYYSVSPADNPKGPEDGTLHVIRGGSWYHDSQGLRPSARDCGDPASYYGFVGFRIAKNK